MDYLTPIKTRIMQMVMKITSNLTRKQAENTKSAEQ